MTTTSSPESRFVEAHGLRLHYLDWGNPEAPPLLLLHGLQDSAALWSTFAESMRDAFHVIALDHRGHGDSPQAKTYRLADYVAEVKATVEALVLSNVVLIGHSAGSKNAWMCIANHPGIAAKLVITDMDPDSFNPGSVAMISRYKDETDEYDTFEDVMERLRSRQPNASDTELGRDVASLTKLIDGNRYTWKRDRNVVTQYDRPDVWEHLRKVAVPTLIIRGADSTLLRHDVAERMRTAIPDCRLVEIPHGGHWAHLEYPENYALEVRNFLLS
jgi:pimeloyl-ACP methyl ester carboxylesterase